MLQIFGIFSGGDSEKKISAPFPKVKKKVKVLYPVSQQVSQRREEEFSEVVKLISDYHKRFDKIKQASNDKSQSSHSDAQRSLSDGQRSLSDGQSSQAAAAGQNQQATSAGYCQHPTTPGEQAAPEASLNENTFVCSYCDKTFKLKYSLTRHIVEYHEANTEVFSCDYCKMSFKRKEHLISHQSLKSCLKNSSFIHECKFCKKGFANADKMKSHVLKNCLKKYFCNICCKFFKKKKDLSSHNHEN